MRRIFVIWNRGYKQQMVIAEDAESALRVSVEARHIRCMTNYRKFEDSTESYVEDEETYPGLREALQADRSGVAELTDHGWLIGGKPLTT